MPWYTVPDLVGQRKVYIKGGMAYVPQSLQISLVLQAFGAKLEKALEVGRPGFRLSRGLMCRLRRRTCLAWTKTSA